MHYNGITDFFTQGWEQYMFLLGEYPYAKYDNAFFVGPLYILFYMCTFMNVVVLLNLLIAIMGSTFGDVSETI